MFNQFSTVSRIGQIIKYGKGRLEEDLGNKKDLVELPKEVVRDLTFKFVSHMDEVIEIALKRPLKLRQMSASHHLQAVLHA